MLWRRPVLWTERTVRRVLLPRSRLWEHWLPTGEIGSTITRELLNLVLVGRLNRRNPTRQPCFLIRNSFWNDSGKDHWEDEDWRETRLLSRCFDCILVSSEWKSRIIQSFSSDNPELIEENETSLRRYFKAHRLQAAHIAKSLGIIRRHDNHVKL